MFIIQQIAVSKVLKYLLLITLKYYIWINIEYIFFSLNTGLISVHDTHGAVLPSCAVDSSVHEVQEVSFTSFYYFSD